MSNALEPLFGERAVQVFDPTNTREKIARLDGDIVTFRQLKDWPKLAEAAKEKVTEIAAFVETWDREVRDAHRPETVPNAGQLKSVAEAEAEWGVSKQAVSRWRASIKDVEGYRERIMLGAYRKAWLDDPPQPTQEAEPNDEDATDDNRWKAVIRALRAINRLAPVEELMTNLPTDVEHNSDLLPRLDQAHEWLNELHSELHQQHQMVSVTIDNSSGGNDG